jgi:protease-4
MRRVVRVVLVIGVLALLARWFWSGSPLAIESGSALVLDVSGEYVESADPPLLSKLAGAPRQTFLSLLSDLAKAERDERIGPIVLRVRDLQIGWAKAQELRDAIKSASEKGHKTVAWIELASFGANLEYFVASAADEVYAAPATRAPVVGLAAERIGRYKSAVETITGRSMSDSMREVADALLDSIGAQFVAGIAQSR